MKRILATISFLFLFANTAAAVDLIPGTNFQYQAWRGAAYSVNGDFSYCAVSAQYNGTQLMFGLGKNSMFISLASPNWSLPTKQKLFATLAIDGAVGQRVFGIGVSRDPNATVTNQITFFFNENNAAQLLTAIAAGKVLHVRTEHGAMNFNLIGTEGSIPALENCFVRAMPTRTNPYSPQDGVNPFSNQSSNTNSQGSTDQNHQWTFLGVSNRGQAYYDPTTLALVPAGNNTNFIQIWTRIVNSNTNTNILSLLVFDCDGDSVIRKAVGLDTGRQINIDIGNDSGSWQFLAIPKGSVLMQLQKIACGGV